jgi:hypothetical protein
VIATWIQQNEKCHIITFEILTACQGAGAREDMRPGMYSEDFMKSFHGQGLFSGISTAISQFDHRLKQNQ